METSLQLFATSAIFTTILDLFVKSSLLLGLCLLWQLCFRKWVSSASLYVSGLLSMLLLMLLPLSMRFPVSAAESDAMPFSLIVVELTPATLAQNSGLFFGLSAAEFLVVLVYAIGLVCLLGRMVHSLKLLSDQRAATIRIDDGRLFNVLQATKSEFGLQRPVVLRTSSTTNSPYSFGLRSPEIVLPAIAETWGQQLLRDVYLHELGHIKRLDWLSLLAIRTIAALYWFNPLVHVAQRQFCTQAEKSCDALVLRHGSNATDYAHNLLKVARDTRVYSSSAATFMARTNELPDRIEILLENNMNIRKKLNKKFVGLTSFGSLLLLVALMFGNTLSVSSAQAASAELVPLSTQQPDYPAHAADDGIAGWVWVSFTVDALGNVESNSANIIDEKPAGVFGDSSLAALSQFKFSPRVEEGAAVAVEGVQYVFRYELSE